MNLLLLYIHQSISVNPLLSNNSYFVLIDINDGEDTSLLVLIEIL